jgi:xylan 1,4-beta-xylosidase
MARSRHRRALRASPAHPSHHLEGCPGRRLQRAGHGQIVETPDGQTYHTHLCSRPLPGTRRSPLGRETAIQKCVWGEDGWLYLAHGGQVPDVEVPAPGRSRPAAAPAPFARASRTALPPEFQWLRTPHPERIFSLTEQPGA